MLQYAHEKRNVSAFCTYITQCLWLKMISATATNIVFHLLQGYQNTHCPFFQFSPYTVGTKAISFQ